MILFVDDERLPPLLYDTHVKTYEDAIKQLETGEVTVISLDHDLGTDKTGYDIAKWIEEAAFCKKIPRLKWKIHSANPEGKEKIKMSLMKADEFWRKNV